MKGERFRDRSNIHQLAGFLLLFCLILLVLPGCKPEEAILPEEEEPTLSVSSPVFHDGEEIPARYTCGGQDISPPLAWSEPSAGTQSFALIVDDPDAPAGVFTHWVLFNLPSDSRQLPEAVSTPARFPGGALQGRNDFGRIGYGGPCPPPGHSHHYRFTLYALERPLDLKEGVSKKQVMDAMQGHILAWGQLTGVYQR